MKEKIKKFKFSKSSILKYIQCPTQFYFHYFTLYGKLYRKLDQAEHLIIGNDLHEFFDEFNKKFDITEIEKILCKDDVYAANINNFYNILIHYNVEHAVESEAKYTADDLSFMGYIDAVYELNDDSIRTVMNEVNFNCKKEKPTPDGNLALIDYKTGKYHDYLHRKYIKELNLYVMLYEACTDKKISYIGMFYTSEPENSFIEPVNKRLLKNDIEDFEKQKQNIYDLKFQRKHNKLCNWCDFKEICDDYTDEYVKEDTKKLYR